MEKTSKPRLMVLTAILFAVMTFVGLPQASAAGGEEDTEVASGTATNIPTDIVNSWAYNQITDLMEKGIVAGYEDKTFKPDNNVARAEFMVMINKAFGYNQAMEISYTDVKAGDWFYNDVAIASAAGYIAGYDDGTMQPNAPVTREQAAVMLAKVLALDTTGYKLLPFTDTNTIGAWSLHSVSALFDAKMISGYLDGTFKPANPINRAEAAVLISKAVADRVPLASVTLQFPAITLQVGKSQTIFVTVKPDNASDKEVRWVSDDSAVATVTNAGYITAVAPGECTVSVTSRDGGKTSACVVTVIP
ncbi:MAG: S-layer homology domain-containing protein [Syntrophomonadaceae bacterium]